MNPTPTDLAHIPLDVFSDAGSPARSSARSRGYAARYAPCSWMCTHIRRLAARLFCVAAVAPGSTPSPPSTNCSTPSKAPRASRAIPTPSAAYSTDSPPELRRLARRLLSGTPVYPEASAAANDNPFPAALAHRLPMYGTNGRWCPNCKAYTHFAVLKRYGPCSSQADYAPCCPTCGAFLLPDAMN